MGLRHHGLVAWQRADDLYIDIHKTAKTALPADERFELSAQLRRAAYSVPANLVEGFARNPGRERLQFLRIAWGSLAEVGYGLHVARRLQYLDEKRYQDLDSAVRAVAAPLLGLIRAERNRIIASHRPSSQPARS
jgi:four helix bundle protein